MINKIFSLFKKNFFRKNFFLIDDEIKLDDLIEKIKSLKVISVDTEFEWRRTYHPRLSLIQICDGNDVFLIDCLLCKNIEKVKFIFESVQILKVFHAVRSDTTVLFSSLGIKTNNVFDVQIAEKIINDLNVKSYSYLVEKYINLSINKSETNSNWMKRPFSNNQLKYASEDVEFLIDIYTKQNKLLDKKGKLKEAFYLSKEEAGLGNQELYISRLQKIKDKSEIDEKIFMWREELAKKKEMAIAASQQAIQQMNLENGSPALGSESAPITIIEFGDYQCEACYAWFHNTRDTLIDNYIETGKAKLIFVDLPFFGRDSPTAAHASYCAEDQGQYWEYHTMLYTFQDGHPDSGWADRDRLNSFAFSLNMNIDEFDECMDSSKYKNVSRQTMTKL